MNNAYVKLKEQHQRELSEFPWFVAFDQKQFEDGMLKLGLDPGDKDSVMSVPPGIIIRKEDENDYYMMHHRWKEEHLESIEDDESGFGYVYDMFSYELNNHEFSYTADPSDAIEASGFSENMINFVPKLHNPFELAKLVTSGKINSEELMGCPILLYESTSKDVKYYLTHESKGKYFLCRYERLSDNSYVCTGETQCKGIDEVRECIQKGVRLDNQLRKETFSEKEQVQQFTKDIGNNYNVTQILAENEQGKPCKYKDVDMSDYIAEKKDSSDTTSTKESNHSSYDFGAEID